MPSAACCSFHPKCRVCTSQESLDWSPNSEACRKEDIRSSNVCIELQYDGQFYGQQRVRNMQLGREDFCDSSGLNMLPEKDSGIPINVSSDGIQNKARDSGVKIGSRDRSRRVQFGNREEHDIEEVWDVLQSWQYKAIYRMVRVTRNPRLTGVLPRFISKFTFLTTSKSMTILYFAVLFGMFTGRVGSICSTIVEKS